MSISILAGKIENPKIQKTFLIFILSDASIYVIIMAGMCDVPPHLGAPSLRIRGLNKHTPSAFFGSMSYVA